MKVKCNLCGLKGVSSFDKPSEWHADRFLMISYGFASGNIKFLCRDCICRVFNSLERESRSIERLHKPEIEPKFKTKVEKTKNGGAIRRRPKRTRIKR